MSESNRVLAGRSGTPAHEPSPLLDAAWIARWALAGVGCAAAGEWFDGTTGTFHLRRRLSITEQQRVGPARDIRGTGEERLRMSALLAAVDPRLAAAIQGLRHG